MNFDDFAFLVLDHARAGHKVAVAEADLATRRQTKILGRRNFAEVVLLDVEHARERDLAASGGCVFGIVDRVHFLGLVFGIVVDHDL